MLRIAQPAVRITIQVQLPSAPSSLCKGAGANRLMNRLSEWVNTWQRRFDVSKCTVIRCTRSLTPFNHVYTLNNHILNLSDQHTYLGVILNSYITILVTTHF